MNILEKQNCPECQSTLVDDMQNGEIICSGCGVVVETRLQIMVQKQLVQILKTK